MLKNYVWILRIAKAGCATHKHNNPHFHSEFLVGLGRLWSSTDGIGSLISFLNSGKARLHLADEVWFGRVGPISLTYGHLSQAS
jgi:hypothetical protein